jgi:hypothetical protein
MTGGTIPPKLEDFLRSVPNPPRIEKPFDIAGMLETVPQALAVARESNPH